jgi:glucoamylase
MPLIWAPAEFIKLSISRQLGYPIDRPRTVWRRYRGRRPTARHAFWWLRARRSTACLPASGRDRFAPPGRRALGQGGWREIADELTSDSGLGFLVAAPDVARLPKRPRRFYRAMTRTW